MFEPGIALAQDISAVVGTAKHAVGDQITYGNANYVYCYNDSTSVINRGLGVVLTTGNTGFSVVMSGATSTRYVAIVEHQSVPTANYFWGLVGGISNASTNSAVTLAPGDAVWPAAAGGLTSTAATGYATAGIQNGTGALGKALAAAAGSTSSGGAKVWYFPLV